MRFKARWRRGDEGRKKIVIPSAPSPVVAPSEVDQPKTYLLSIVRVPLKPGDRIEGFSFTTWGVRFKTVCHIPGGWIITAGGSATPEGMLKGEGSLGATWLGGSSSRELDRLALVTLYGPVRRHDVGSLTSGGVTPATFKGHALLSSADSERKIKLTWANIQLSPATGCPSPESDVGKARQGRR